MSAPATYYAAIDSGQAKTGAAEFNKATASMRQGADAVDRATDGMRAGFGLLKTAMAALAIGETTRRIIEASDSFVTMRGRMEALTGSSENAQAAMDAMAAAANRTRTPSTELSSTYLRMQGAMEGLKRPASDAVQLTETLAKVVKVSGISGTEAAAGMMQLAQAIASGRFQGDEFRSVAENMPIVMKLLQEQTGKTAGQLRGLASDGKLTADILVTALLNSVGKVDAQFAKLPQTAGAALGMLGDDLARVTGKMGEQSGVSKAWADAIDEVRKIVTSPDFASGLKTVTDGVAGIGRAAADTIPNLVILARALAKQKLDVVEGVDFFEQEKAALKALGDMFGGWFKSQVDAAAESLNGNLLTGLSKTSAAALAASDAMKTLGRGAATKDWGSVTTTTKENPITFAENQQVQILRLQNELIRAQTAGDGKRIAQLQTEIAVRQTVTDELKLQDKELAAKLEREIRLKGVLDQQKEARGITDQIETLKLQNRLIDAQAAGDETITAALENQLAVRQTVTREMRAAHPELAKQLEAQTLITKEAERTAQKTQELRQQGQQFGSILADGLHSLTLEGNGLQATLGNVVKKLADMVFQLTVAEPLAKSLGNMFANSGGISSLLGSLTGSSGGSAIASGWGATVMPFADGGVFGGPIALAGAGGFRGVMAEDGPEAIMPLTRGPDGALGVKASGGGTTTQAVINVYGDVTDGTVSKIAAAFQGLMGAAAPQIVKQAVSAVAAENRANRNYLAR